MRQTNTTDADSLLSTTRILRAKDVADLMGISHMAVLHRLRRGTLPVKPRSLSKPYEWSSIEWRRWFEGK